MSVGESTTDETVDPVEASISDVPPEEPEVTEQEGGAGDAGDAGGDVGSSEGFGEDDGGAGEGEGAGEGAGPAEAEPSEEPDWRSDGDIVALARSYGIDEAGLASFESGMDFHRACRMVDQAVTRMAQKEEPPKEEPSKEEPPKEPSKKPLPTEEDDLTLDPAKYDMYDEEVQRLAKAARRLQEENKAVRADLVATNERVQQKLDQFDRERKQALHDTEMAAFHDVMDKMPEDLFGGEKDLTKETDTRRQQVWEAYERIVQTLPRESGGKRPKLPPRDVLVRRAAFLAFGEEMLETQKKKIYRELHEQSRGRRPSPSKNKVVPDPAPTDKPMTISENTQRLLKDPEIAAIFDRDSEETGNAPQ